MSKKKLPIPKFKNIEEMANFWDNHDTEDYQWEPAEVKFSKNLISVYKKVMPIRLDDQTKAAIEKVAKAKGIGTSTTARMLIRERLAQMKAL